jgi:hypothetical protein
MSLRIIKIGHQSNFRKTHKEMFGRTNGKFNFKLEQGVKAPLLIIIVGFLRKSFQPNN